MRLKLRYLVVALVAVALVVAAAPAAARPPIRTAFFNVYPAAETSRLDDLPSNNNHCGVCHFDFGGGGARNLYGVDVETAIPMHGGDEELAIAAIEGMDSDNDGFSNLIEITDLINFSNTPTFPGLTAGNVGSVSNVDQSEIIDHLTPTGGSDTTPPTVAVLSPDGGENLQATTVQSIQWTATDANGVLFVHLQFSDDDGATWQFIALNEPNDGQYDWFVPNRPGGATRVRVVAFDASFNQGDDFSDAPFTVMPVTSGVVPSTLRDFDLPGTQPFRGGILEDPNVTCRQCHGDYDTAAEPWHNWHGSMMGQAARDPVFLATLVIAEQDAPSAGDLCLRCHSPGGWQEGRSTDTSGGMLNLKDRHGVQCDACHRLVDFNYMPGTSPIQDLPILDSLDALPFTYANGQFIGDPDPIKRGPFADPEAPHPFLESPFHRSSNLCGTCHDVSNPAFIRTGGPREYSPQAFDAPHPTGDPADMFPVERTFSEWSISDYAQGGVFAPEFAGSKPDGIVSSCQDCHMRDIVAAGCNDQNAPIRPDQPLHDMTGGNYFVPDIITTFYPGEADPLALQDARQRAIAMLELAATLDLEDSMENGLPKVEVTVTNQTGHKLPTGYPEGRRMWLGVRAFDANSELVYESGAYDASTGVLTHDQDLALYEIKPGISSRLGAALSVTAGPSFHFVLNDTIYFDNRIPPRGFTNAALENIQSPVVGASYEDGEYWDSREYTLPANATLAEVTLYYQSTSKEYIEFLRDENQTNSLGQDLHDAWVAQGRAAPVAMVSDTVHVQGSVAVAEVPPTARFFLAQNRPNPFNPSTRIAFSLERTSGMRLRIIGAGGRVVRIFEEEALPAGPHTVVWDGRDAAGREVASGVYAYELEAGGKVARRKAVLLR